MVQHGDGTEPTGGAGWEAANRLLLVLANATQPGFAFRALRFLEACELPRDDDLFVELVDRLSAPSWSAQSSSGFRSGCRDRSRRPVRIRRLTFSAAARSRISGHGAATSPRTCSALSTGTCGGFTASNRFAGNPDPYDGRSAVERHPQNFGARGVDFLVDAARDLWEILLEDLPETAIGYLQAWTASAWPVLNRLAIHGWCQRTDTSADEKLGWLLSQDGWTRDNRLRHETMRLIAATVPHACEGSIEKLLDQIVVETEPADQPSVFNRLGWIARHAPSPPRRKVPSLPPKPRTRISRWPSTRTFGCGSGTSPPGRCRSATSTAPLPKTSPTAFDPTRRWRPRRSFAAPTA